ncbi:MMPL family transporter [Streptomyces sp. TLI_105]|uniref:MMPL family transporter n=1 Tax=Streptomyces sp. TLI_105 TaxID=1881019 RepID=UPI000D1AEE87
MPARPSSILTVSAQDPSACVTASVTGSETMSTRSSTTARGQGIVFVPVIGARTEHALLPAARCREGAVGQPDTARAMTAACRATAPPVPAGAATIACAMMTPTSSDLPAEQAMGPAVNRHGLLRRGVTDLLAGRSCPVRHRALRSRAARGTGGRRAKTSRSVGLRPRRVRLGCLVLLAAGAGCAPLLS